MSFRPENGGPREIPNGSPEAFATPILQAWSLINSTRWNSPHRDRITSYICSCFSELAYLHLTDKELDPSGRYKLVPSLAYRALAEAGLSFDLTSTARLDFPSFVFETDKFFYAGFEVRDVALIAIRGTQPSSIADWAINFSARLRYDDLTPGRLHEGFLREATKATPRILDHLMAFKNAKNIRFTGHSLGGALATVLHRRWTHGPSLAPYSFGAPRIGDRDSTQILPPFAYNRPYDLVPHLPPMRFGYRNADASPEILSDDPMAAPPSSARVVLDWVPRPGGRPFAIQHAIERYRRLLGRRVAPEFPDLIYWEFAQAQMRQSPC